MTISFYRINEPYGELSNFSRHGFDLDGLYWPTVEHYYQAQKFVGTPHFDTVRMTLTPFKARLIGNDRQRPLRSGWDDIREDVMWRAIGAKFRANLDAGGVLLATGSEYLIEASPYDSFWGYGPNQDGENRFGKMLVRLREELRREMEIFGSSQ